MAKNIPFSQPKEIFQSAESFNSAAYYMLRNSIEFMKLGKQDYGLKFMAANFANHALAIELYLKCLQCEENNYFTPIHRLDKLFDSLSPKTQDRIITHFNTLSGKNDFTIRIHLAIGHMKNLDFYSLLSDAANAFEVCRYSFENGIGEGYMMHDISDAVRSTIIEGHSDWEIIVPS